MLVFRYLFVIIFVSCIACNENKIYDLDNLEVNLKHLNDQDINFLKNSRIFFGHMSVGYNIIDGIKNIISENSQLNNFSLIEISDSVKIARPGFYHKRNGKNGYPVSKCDAFKNFLLEDSLGKEFDVAFFKFCYVDLNSESNVNDIFQYYKRSIEDIKSAFPKLQIIHVTIPLMGHNYSIKNSIKNFIKGDKANIKRNQFNQLLLENYDTVDPIFNLAKVESTYPNGSREYFTSNGKNYFSLIKAYSNDGGHLNKMGRKLAAIELLNILISINN